MPRTPANFSIIALALDHDLVVDGAVGEMVLLHLVPAAEGLLYTECFYGRKAARILMQDLFAARAEGVLGDDLLALRREQELEIGGGDLARALLVDDLVIDQRDRRRRLDAERGIDDIELVGAELRADRRSPRSRRSPARRRCRAV